MEDSYQVGTMVDSLMYVMNGCDWLSEHLLDFETLATKVEHPIIETIIGKLTLLSCNLRTLRNRREIINDLPTEILAYIFELLTDPWPPLMAHHELSDGIGYPSQVLIGVCRHWRNVAYHTPSLWSLIQHTWRFRGDEKEPYYFPQINLDRSGSVPLTVWIKGVTDEGGNLFAKIMDQIARVRDLRLYDTFDAELHKIPLGDTKSPLLRTLCIMKSYEYRNSPDLPWHVPLVENLQVDGFTSWLNNAWPNLRCICLSGTSTWTLQTIQLFLDCLMQVGPSLEDLVIMSYRLSKEAYEKLHESQQTITLPSLKRIVESDVDKYILQVLTSRLVLSSACSQQLRVLYFELGWSKAIHQLDCATPERIFIRNDQVVGVRGSSAFYVNTDNSGYETTAMGVPHETVTELWLCSLHEVRATGSESESESDRKSGNWTFRACGLRTPVDSRNRDCHDSP